MKKIALPLTLAIFVVLTQSFSNEESKEAPSEYYTYAGILGKWLAIDSDNSEHYEFFKNASYLHTQGDSIEKRGGIALKKHYLLQARQQRIVHNQGTLDKLLLSTS